MWEYTDKVKDHYLNPRNSGEIKNPDGFGEIGNITCGDALRLTFKLDKEGKVEDIKFKTFGCGSAIASASVLTELCKGKTVKELKKISNQEIADALGGLPREKMHCSVMGQEALEAAITYYETGGKKAAPKQKDGKVVCTCFNVTDQEIIRAIKENNLKTVDDVTNFTKAGGGCGGCLEEIEEIINSTLSKSSEKTSQAAPVRLTTLQKIDKIREVLQKDVRPVLEKDGGDCELVDVDGNDVYIRFKGSCSGCAFSSMTLISVVEKNLKEKVSDQLVVKTT
ncbi:Fe-S cluster assembly protein NifU [Chitinispirillales bacterium ANBcel5]|uniref:Fe-S cluster assembly protein NifU n=1 Tax=Cellulosispirillum alkaliphilum TaxID=3039283 RepID=UPI002A52D123|nr:Fe-S cluster assembly protein NifU [Chitinispirillales bacterium ANBcel5]